MGRVLIFSLLSTLSTWTSAWSKSISDGKNECPYVRLDENGGPFEKIPVYDQERYAKEDPNTCYAITAAELIDAYRISKNINLNSLTAPLSLALNYKILQDELPLEEQEVQNNQLDREHYAISLLGYGVVGTALLASENQIVCDQKYLQIYDDVIAPDLMTNIQFETDDDSTSENFLKNIFNQIESQSSGLNSFFRSKLNSRFVNEKSILDSANIARKGDTPLRKADLFLRELCRSNSFKIKIPTARSLPGFSDNFFQERDVMDEKRRNPDLNYDEKIKLEQDFWDKFSTNRKTKKLSTQISLLLSAKYPQAVGISYCRDTIVKNYEVECPASHASIIIGQRSNLKFKSCDYLVRDSFGTSCTNSYGQPKYAWPCEKGNVWVPAHVLLQKADTVTWIPDVRNTQKH